jgi:hypothetical protein
MIPQLILIGVFAFFALFGVYAIHKIPGKYRWWAFFYGWFISLITLVLKDIL